MTAQATVTARAGIVVAAALAVVGLAICLLAGSPASIALYVVYNGLGLYLIARVPSPARRIGWLLLVAGWGIGIGAVVIAFDPRVLVDGTATSSQWFIAWASSSGWALGFCSFVVLAIVFPSGRLPSGWMGMAARALIVAVVLIAVAIGFGPTINITLPGQPAGVDVPNPIAIWPEAFSTGYPGVSSLYPMEFVIFLGALGTLLIRYARSVGMERLQYRWLVAAIVLAAIANAIWAIATFGLGQDADGPANLVTVIVYALVPTAIAVAVLRYRLYDIDRIISRTIAYSATLVVLAGVFALAIVSISTVLATVAQGRSVAVAAATLLACLAAQPVARIARSAVDRRFDRARYDAERTTVSFADRLRTETDVDAVTRDLIATARATVAPTSSAVWIR